MATYWENSCSFGLLYVSWYKYLIVGLVFSHLGFWSGNLFLVAPFPDLCLLVPFNGYSDTRSVQENFNLITSFIQESADKHIPSKTSRSVSSVPWITPEIRRKIRRKNATHAKAKKTGSAKFRSKFESLRKEIKADIRKQHDLYVNNLVGDVKANPRDFTGT